LPGGSGIRRVPAGGVDSAGSVATNNKRPEV
jgi:hypothetical protein